MDYTELKDLVLTILDNDSEEITAMYEPALRSVESQVNSQLRTRQMLKTLPVIDFTGETIAIPDDLLEIKKIETTINGRTMPLEMLGTLDASRFGNSNGPAVAFAFEGTEIRLVPSAKDQSFNIQYVARVPALTETNPTNWLLDIYPDIYISGLLSELFLNGLFDEQRGNIQFNKFMSAIGAVTQQDNTAQWMGGSLTMRLG